MPATALVKRSMRATTRAGIYAASVPTRNLQARRMDFYVVATETDGAQLLKGSAEMPLIRELLPQDARAETAIERTVPIEERPPAARTRSSSGMMKYVYIGLGVLAVGALAAANSGGGSSDEGCKGEDCDLTLTLPPR